MGEEEWLLVLAGEPTLRTPDGTEVLRPWDVAVFPRRELGANGRYFRLADAVDYWDGE